MIKISHEATSEEKKQMHMYVLFVELSGPEVIKLFFMLNSTEHEIFPAHKLLAF